MLTVKEYQAMQQERVVMKTEQQHQQDKEEEDFGVWDQFLQVLDRFYPRGQGKA